MKPAHFILTSDFATVRKTGENELKITIPNSITMPTSGSRYIVATASAKIGNKGDFFNCFYTSSASNYTCFAVFGITKPSGASSNVRTAPEMYLNVTSDGETYTLEAMVYRSSSQTQEVLTGYGQTITAHIYTFKDPFSE